MISKSGEVVDKAKFGAQAAGRLERKYGEKYIKEFFKEALGTDLELTMEEWDDLWRGFEQYWGRQWNEFVHTDDRDLFS
ncbi:MAG: hypothetical protein KBA31_19610 [Alphaproteobacteria bacterium]|nr:hypothetical protein [Alphaproteobacteria bacterium]